MYCTACRNYYGERAVDVACRRVKNSSAGAKERIVQLIEGIEHHCLSMHMQRKELINY